MADKLTHKQQTFCKEIVLGATQSDAYRKAYDAENMTDKSIHELSSVLAAGIKVASRIEELREEYSTFLNYDAKAHFEDMDRMREIALVPMGESGNINVNAAIKIGRASCRERV